MTECGLCGTRRRAVNSDALCDYCAEGIAATVRMVPVRTAPPGADLTAYVERYRPPVPPSRVR